MYHSTLGLRVTKEKTYHRISGRARASVFDRHGLVVPPPVVVRLLLPASLRPWACDAGTAGEQKISQSRLILENISQSTSWLEPFSMRKCLKPCIFSPPRSPAVDGSERRVCWMGISDVSRLATLAVGVQEPTNRILAPQPYFRYTSCYGKPWKYELAAATKQIGDTVYSVTGPPLSSKCGTYKTVKPIFWRWLSRQSSQNHLSYSLFGRQRTGSKDGSYGLNPTP